MVSAEHRERLVELRNSWSDEFASQSVAALQVKSIEQIILLDLLNERLPVSEPYGPSFLHLLHDYDEFTLGEFGIESAHELLILLDRELITEMFRGEYLNQLQCKKLRRVVQTLREEV